MSEPLLIARTPDTKLFLLPGMANRHGLITGATGTGKTVTLQKLAESLSEIGVPVFMADVKGDLTVIFRRTHIDAFSGASSAVHTNDRSLTMVDLFCLRRGERQAGI
ncbi:helicase HerA-like domain-containing protein, partial [Escherichia coli]|uniref:helicase HerA-like domain-containing protein n=1 Tax=Escherichia coli TaxID=562 RepID=UPI00201AC5AA